MPEHVEFQLRDLMVISILWINRMFSLWLYSMCVFTFEALFPDREVQSATYYYINVWVFFFACAGMMFGALLVDTVGYRYAMSLTGLCLCCSTPFIGVFTCITKAVPAAILMFFMASTINIVSPATYCLIFNQNLDPKRRHARLVVSFSESMECLLGKYLAYVCIPESPSGDYHEIHFAVFLWVMFIPLLATMIILLERMKKHVTGDFVNEKGIKCVLHGIFSDFRIQPPKRKGKSLIQLVFFILLLLPSLCITSLGAALENAHSDHEAKAERYVLKHISLSTNVMIIPFTELVLTLIPMLKETSREILIVGFAHVVNIAVLSLFIFQLDQIPVIPLNSVEVRREFTYERNTPERLRGDSEVCIDSDRCSMPHPGQGEISFLVLATVNVSLHTEPQVFFDKIPFRLDALRLMYGVHSLPAGKSDQSINLSYQLASVTPATSFSKIVKLREKKHYVFVLTSDNRKNIGCTVTIGMEIVKSKALPKLILFNSLCNKIIEGVAINNEHNEYRISSTVGGMRKRLTFPLAGRFLVADLPVGEVKVSYKYKGGDPTLTRILTSDSATFTTEPLTVYLAFVLHDSSQLFLHIRRIYKSEAVTTPPVTTSSTVTTSTEKPPPRKPDPIQQSTYALSGAAFGIATVGYTHFFWVESPVRLRAIMFAIFRVSNDLVRWTTEKVVGDSLTRSAAIALLSLQVITTVWHVGLSWIYQTIVNPPSTESTMETPP